MRTPFRRWAVVIAAAALTTAAAAQTGKPKVIPNSTKYSDLGSHPATGRSGSAMLTGRALINKDQSTDIELTSRVVGSAAAAGNIAKVQFKALGKSGNPIFVTNWNGLTGGSYFHQTINGLARKQQFQIQGNITGIDGARTDVVTLIQTAVLRPDLMVSGITPSTGMANVPINITAVVQELNGDTGAHANCVLYINNTLADQASSIWVDAGKTVSCMFTHTFPAAGTYNLKVAVENVMPADYDSSNNSATATITIASADNLGYTATASDYQLNDSSQETTTEYFDGQVVYFNGSQASDSGWEQWSDLLFAKQSGLLVFPVNATIAESSDGSSTILNGNFANITADSTSTSQCSPSATCSESTAWRQDGEFSLFLDVKTVSDTMAGTSGSFSGEVQRNAGDVTYLSAFAYCTWSADPNCPGDAVYVSNQPNEQASGTRLTFGTVDMLQFAMTDAGGTQYSANPTIPLTSSVLQSQQPWSCSNSVITSDITFTSCSSINKSSVGVAGSVTTPPQ